VLIFGIDDFNVYFGLKEWMGALCRNIEGGLKGEDGGTSSSKKT